MIFGCQENSIHFHSPDRSQSITVLTFAGYRYVIDGSHHQVPKKNFVKLDISHMDRVTDELFICWGNENFDWEVLNPNARIMENKLDTTRFKFLNSFQTDQRGIPIVIKYHNEGCFEFGFYTKNIRPADGAIIE